MDGRACWPGTGTKGFHHPVVGDLLLAWDGMELAAEPGLTLTIYTYTAKRLRLLASWAASQEAGSATRPFSPS